MICKKIFATLFVLLMSMSLRAQQGADETAHILSYIQQAMNFNRVMPQEKVYLHFDNMGYFENETMWFKAYVVRTDSTRPSNLSRVLYVELINPSGDVIKTQKLHLDTHGQAHGDMKLDTLMGSGFYEVRAYTRHMTNWGVNACFSRVFPIYKAPREEGDYHHPTLVNNVLYRQRDPNVRDRQDSLYQKAIDEGIYTHQLAQTISAHFYPEGGNLVEGKECRVAMLAVDDNGRCYQGEGWIMNDNGEVLAKAGTDSLGRGAFKVVPDGRRMRMQMKNLKGRTQWFDLPQAKRDGCALMLDAINDEMVAQLRSTDRLCGHTLAYIIMHNGNIVRADTMKAAPLIEIEMGRNTLPEGVNQLTVIDGQGKILAERLFFICPRNEKSDALRVSTPTARLTPCGKVTIDLQTHPDAHLSFSAIDAATMNGGTRGNIKTWMLLSSEVKGYIHNVDYYFEADDSIHRQAADLLMLTQGWRRYDWEMMCGLSDMEERQPVEDCLYIDGKLREFRKYNKRDNVELKAFLYNKDGQSLKGETKTDTDGNYAFGLPDISGEWNLQLFTLLDNKRKTFHVGINRQFSPLPRFITPIEASVTPPNLPNLFVRRDSMATDEDVSIPLLKKERILKNVTVSAKHRYFTNDNWQYKNEDYGRRYATVFYDIDKELDRIRDLGEDEPDLFTFLCKRNPLFNNPECINLPRTFILPDKEDVERLIKSYHEYFDWNGSMAYANRGINWIVDNGVTHNQGAESDIKSFKGDIFFPTDLSEIKSIYIVPYSPWENDIMHESRVRIYLYLHHRFSTASQKGLRRTYFQGFNIPSTFQMEDYSVLPPTEDLRRTLYWNPTVTTDEQGHATVEFYNNSSCTEMYISAEGMTKDGHFIVNEK